MADAPVLRDYQLEAVDGLRAAYGSGCRAPVLQLATGGGKTLVFAEIARGARVKTRRVLVLVHRRELVRQASAKLTWSQCPHGIVAAGFEPAPDELVQVASVQTMVRRLPTLPRFDLIVVDEAHHGVAATWRKIFAAMPAAKLLGVTATPARLDGRGLGIEDDGVFDTIVSGPSIGELIAGGYLSPIRCYAPRRRLNLAGVRTVRGDYAAGALAERVDKVEISGNAVTEYRLRANHQPAIAFCVTVAHAERVAAAFCEAGYRAAAVHGALPMPERDRLIAGLGTGAIEVLASCDLISEGLDAPAVAAVILLRPTKSLCLFLQQVGRGMRPAPGKRELVVLDLAANCLRHGLPDIDRQWRLGGDEKVEGDAPLRACPECSAFNPIGAESCIASGFVFPRRPGRIVTEVEDVLDEVTPERLAAVVALPYSATAKLSEAELHAYAQARGYKPGWVHHRMREQQRQETP